MLKKKNLTSLNVRAKIISPEIWGKKIRTQTRSPIPPPPPPHFPQ